MKNKILISTILFALQSISVCNCESLNVADSNIMSKKQDDNIILPQRQHKTHNANLTSDEGHKMHDFLPQINAKLAPTVVSIRAVRNVKMMQNVKIIEYYLDKYFNETIKEKQVPEVTKKQESMGTGVVIDGNGYIITNHHVVADADEITIKLHDDTKLTAKLVGSDRKTDIALLKVDTNKPLPYATFGNSSTLQPLSKVIIFGNPFGLSGSTITGEISKVSRDLDIPSDIIIDNFIQISSYVNMGYSGGPVFDLKGEVIGIVSMSVMPQATLQSIQFQIPSNIAFAIPVNTVKEIVEKLKEHGKVTRYMLRIQGMPLNSAVAEQYNIDKDQQGVLVISTEDGYPGARCGIQPGDIITKFRGKQIKTFANLKAMVSSTPADSEVEIEVLRNNKPVTLKCKMTASDVASDDSAVVDSSVINGIKLVDLSAEVISKNNITNIDSNTKGLLVLEVNEDSPWKKKSSNIGLVAGDIILGIKDINAEELQVKQLAQKISSIDKNMIFCSVKRGNNTIYVILPNVEQPK